LLEAQIEMNFLSLALGNAMLRELQHDEFDRFWDVLHRRVVEAQRLGQISPRIDAAWITHQLIILVEGLSLEAALYPARAQPKRQREILESFFAQVSEPEAADGGAGDSPAADASARVYSLPLDG
jgi:hypothetical protein